MFSSRIDQSIVSPKIIIDPFEYKNLALVVPSNDYEQIQREEDIDPEPGQSKAQDQIVEPIPPISQDKSCSVDDLSRTSGDQTSSKCLHFILILYIDLLISLSIGIN